MFDDHLYCDDNENRHCSMCWCRPLRDHPKDVLRDNPCTEHAAEAREGRHH